MTWKEQARCRRFGTVRNSPFDSEVYSRDRVNVMQSHSIRVAKAICIACPVRRECLLSQLEVESEHRGTLPGVWGGTLPVERREARRSEQSVEHMAEALLARMDEQARAYGLARREGAA
jgi:hypothetical protein